MQSLTPAERRERRAASMRTRRRREQREARAEAARRGYAQAFYCRTHPCFICESWGKCRHREADILALPAEVLVRESRLKQK